MGRVARSERIKAWGARGAAAAVAVALGLTGCAGTDDDADRRPTTTSTSARGSSAENRPPPGRDVVVTSITDGDTFRAGDERVRLIGIDTPEISGGVECFGREASDALASLIPIGTEVRLVPDVEPTDRYDRTLAYVYRLSDGLFVNLRMAEDGFATPLTIPPNVAHSDDFVAAAAGARDAGRGLWSTCDAPDDTVPPTTVAPSSGGACDHAYPDVCIPPAPPDLDCADIPHRRFRVLPPDPHRFDGGGDGLGCERD